MRISDWSSDVCSSDLRYRLWISDRWASDWHSSWWRLRGYLRIGGPIALTLASEVGLFSLAVQLMGRLGADAVAAHQIALQWATISFKTGRASCRGRVVPSV